MRLFFLAIMIFAIGSQQSLAADPYENVAVVHDVDNTRKFPGQGTVANWHAGRARCLAAQVALKAKDYENAVASSEEAIKIYPYEGDFYNQLGIALWQRKKPGDFERGIENVRKAVDISPDTCIFWDNLAKGLAGVEKLQEARDALVHASQCKTTPAKLAEIKLNIGIIDRTLDEKKKDHAN